MKFHTFIRIFTFAFVYIPLTKIQKKQNIQTLCGRYNIKTKTHCGRAELRKRVDLVYLDAIVSVRSTHLRDNTLK